MSKESISTSIPIIIVIVLVTCIFINHSIKKKAFYNAVDETLIRNLMVGASTEGDFGTVICTKENIKNVSITSKSVHLGVFTKRVLVDFDITIETNGKVVNTTGFLDLVYDKEKKSKWRVSFRMIRNKDVTIYGN